jgi:hypothetical protein
MKKILIQNQPRKLSQAFGVITAVPHTPLSDHTQGQIQAMFDLNKQEMIQASALLGIQPTTQEIKDSPFAAAIDGWLTNLDGMILSIDKERFIRHYLSELSDDFYKIIFGGYLDPGDADKQVDNDIIHSVIAIHQLFNKTICNLDVMHWSHEEWKAFLLNEIKTPLEKLIKPQDTTDLEAIIAQIDQLAAHIRES